MRHTVAAAILTLLWFLPTGGYAQSTPPSPRQAPPKPASKPAPRPAPHKGWSDIAFLSLDGSFQVASTEFSTETLFDENVEEGSSRNTYRVKNRQGWNGAGTVRVWRNLAIGVGVSQFRQTNSADVSALVPHPFFFGQPRTIEGVLDGIRREETAVHVSANWVAPVGRHLVVSVGAGPSFFSVKQGFADLPRWDESYPFDTATFIGADLREASTSKVGFNAGLDVGWYFTRSLGVGFDLRYAHANVTIDAPGGPVDVKVGGLQVGAGLRVLFKGAPRTLEPRRPGATPARSEPGRTTPVPSKPDPQRPAGASVGAGGTDRVTPMAPEALDLVPAQPVSEAPPAWIPGHTPPSAAYRARLELAIGVDGRVLRVRFLESSHRGLDHYVRLAAQNWRYKPATRKGAPVESIRIVDVEIAAR
jgi:outer membrane biosynthesis protein TonB